MPTGLAESRITYLRTINKAGPFSLPKMEQLWWALLRGTAPAGTAATASWNGSTSPAKAEAAGLERCWSARSGDGLWRKERDGFALMSIPITPSPAGCTRDVARNPSSRTG